MTPANHREASDQRRSTPKQPLPTESRPHMAYSLPFTAPHDGNTAQTGHSAVFGPL
jgi:hypothetical protein